MNAARPHAAQVSGLGVVCSIGHDVLQFGQSLAEGRCGVVREPMPAPSWAEAKLHAPIAGFDFATALQPYADHPGEFALRALRLGRRASLPVQASITSAAQAWTQARLHMGDVAEERIGLVIAGHNTTQSDAYRLYPDFQQHPQHLSPRYAIQFMDSNHLGVLSEAFSIRGEGFVAGGASASGNVGLLQGLRMIEAGVADVCLVCAVAAELSPMEHRAFHAIGALGGKAFADRPGEACRPFDSQHEGFVPGQASVCVVLESQASAEARGAQALATLLGGAMALHATSTSEPDMAGEARVMHAALQRAGLSPGDVDYLNTHGSSSPLGDEVELQAIQQVFGDHFPRLWLNATKGLAGHCLQAAALLEAVAIVVQMQRGCVHPNRNLERPIHAAARFSGSAPVDHRIRIAASNAFGFSGIDTCVVFANVAGGL
ncbi:beta-ketoacyl synthase N-terminal-like domain-containing protein [Xanthomonas campestris pv. fici]|uniref:beta-ketoacyl synthase N-terminal-like domain-containing protein n=1 Tax=Xanthomonas euvesicatoria TaxID=456327 RepID=UPI003556D9FC